MSSVRRTQNILNHIVLSPSESKIEAKTCGSAEDDKKTFVEVFPLLAHEIMKELPTTFEQPSHALRWMEKLMEINVQGGKMNRGLTVIHSLQSLKENQSLTRNEEFNAHVLGWCIEWLQAFFLVADDIMDQSLTRRGVPCWYRQPLPINARSGTVGLVAINDAFLLESMIYRILSKYFRDQPYYVEILELFHEVSYQTELGQLLDLTQPPRGNFTAFTLDNYKKIVKYKTAYYSFYLPVALAMLMAGITSKPAFEAAQEILLPMGEYFQIQDDYLDCYGDPKVIGKVGRDIEENKCSWLVVQFLLHCNPSQRSLLEHHYGLDNPKDVSIIKNLYKDVGIEKIFKQYEDESYKMLTDKIKKVRIIPQDVFFKLLSKIYKRSL
eukprot:TRINITY_DN739_c0_g1_i1.p1 TRINITY_DN739_c0_g1~~TRINITY_DN739_c0_g1_i1.p1  ORF type:complete len:445 (-),score=88.84 TRINITY_DN739_c0_g1_i1:64-1206(-)